MDVILTALLLAAIAAPASAAGDFQMPAEFGTLVEGARKIAQMPQRPISGATAAVPAGPAPINLGFLAMGAPTNSMDAGQIFYNPGADAGEIAWKFNGVKQKDTFKGGRAGSRGMAITLNGNNHEFTQD